MKITKQLLKEIIQEEVNSILQETAVTRPPRHKMLAWYLEKLKMRLDKASIALSQNDIGNADNEVDHAKTYLDEYTKLLPDKS